MRTESEDGTLPLTVRPYLRMRVFSSFVLTYARFEGLSQSRKVQALCICNSQFVSALFQLHRNGGEGQLYNLQAQRQVVNILHDSSLGKSMHLQENLGQIFLDNALVAWKKSTILYLPKKSPMTQQLTQKALSWMCQVSSDRLFDCVGTTADGVRQSNLGWFNPHSFHTVEEMLVNELEQCLVRQFNDSSYNPYLQLENLTCFHAKREQLVPKEPTYSSQQKEYRLLNHISEVKLFGISFLETLQASRAKICEWQTLTNDQQLLYFRSKEKELMEFIEHEADAFRDKGKGKVKKRQRNKKNRIQAEGLKIKVSQTLSTEEELESESMTQGSINQAETKNIAKKVKQETSKTAKQTKLNSKKQKKKTTCPLGESAVFVGDDCHSKLKQDYVRQSATIGSTQSEILGAKEQCLNESRVEISETSSSIKNAKISTKQTKISTKQTKISTKQIRISSKQAADGAKQVGEWYANITNKKRRCYVPKITSFAGKINQEKSAQCLSEQEQKQGKCEEVGQQGHNDTDKLEQWTTERLNWQADQAFIRQLSDKVSALKIKELIDELEESAAGAYLHKCRVYEKMVLLMYYLDSANTLTLFGSSQVGLALPSSDLDLMVSNTAWSDFSELMIKDLMVALAAEICKTGWVVSCNLLLTARVPLMKLVISVRQKDNPLEVTPSQQWIQSQKITLSPEKTISQEFPLVKVDLMINTKGEMNSGLQATERIKQDLQKHPLLRRIVLFLKAALCERGLNENYTGGLSSYCVFLMVTTFLEVCGEALDQDQFKIVTSLLRYYLLLDLSKYVVYSAAGQLMTVEMYYQLNAEKRDTSSKLRIVDPINGKLICASFHRFQEVKQLFTEILVFFNRVQIQTNLICQREWFQKPDIEMTLKQLETQPSIQSLSLNKVIRKEEGDQS